MLTLQSLMLVALGVLLASLIVIGVLPAYRSRVRRLTADEIRRSIPLTEAEIRADKDKLRAQFAIRVHKLESEGEQLKLNAARQRIELNRRDAKIAEIDDEKEKLRAVLEENVNARRVLEHTVTDRLPRLEMQLESARALIEERDQEMAALRSETTRSVRALDEAMQMNAQQRSEVDRLASSLNSRHAPLPEKFTDPKFDGEMALRSEIEALRAKTREQASLISQMQAAVSGEPEGDVEKLRRELADAEAALRSTRDSVQAGTFDRAAAEAQAKSLNAKIDAQASDIARLTAALAVYEGAGEASEGKAAAGGSRLASKAKLNSLQAQVAQQNDIILRLRSELAASNERLARQAAHYMDEMRRLGSGTVPTSIDTRRGRDTPRRGLADRINQTVRPSAVPDGAADERVAKLDVYAEALTGEDGDRGSKRTPGSVGDVTAAAGEPAMLAEAITAPPKRKLRLLERISSGGKV